MVNNGFGNYNNTGQQIACRLCNRIFSSTQALITHIESHMEHEEVAIRRLYFPEHIINSQRQQLPPHRFSLPIAPPTQSPIASSISQPKRNPFVSVGQVGSSQSIRPMQFPSLVTSYAGNNNNIINNNNNVGGGGLLAQFPSPQTYQWKPEEEESASDGTKPFIMQLEKPIKKIDYIDLDNNDDGGKLDLELRL